MMNPLSNLPAPQPAAPQGSVSGAPAPSAEKSFENMLSGGPKGKAANAEPREGAQPAKSAASSPRAAGVSGKESATSAGRGEPDAELSASVELEKDGTTQLNDSAEEGEEVDREQNLADPTLEALLIGIPLWVPQPKTEPVTVSWNETGTAGEDAGSLSLNDELSGQESAEFSPRGDQDREEQPTAQFSQQPGELDRDPSSRAPAAPMNQPRMQESPQAGSQEAAIFRPESLTARRGIVSASPDKPLFQAKLGKPSDAEEHLHGPDAVAGIRAFVKDAQPAGAGKEETGQPEPLQAAVKPDGMAPAKQESAMQKPASNRSNPPRAATFAASENSAATHMESFPNPAAFTGQLAGPVLESPSKATEVSRQEMVSIVNQTVDAAQRIKATGPERVEVKLQLESGETLSIQLQLTRGEVKPVFRAESESLRVALEQNWAQFSNRAEERGVRLASAVFESQPSSLGMNDQPGRQSGRERGEPAPPQENLPSQTPFRRIPTAAKSSATLLSSAGVQLYA